jgi:LPS O-antigen subunit length determinant protein (WzzB/FepE family)
MSSGEGGQVTGTKDKDYNLVWFTEQSLSNALRLEGYIQDAERDGDQELADFFRRAQDASKRGGEAGKEMLRKKLGS